MKTYCGQLSRLRVSPMDHSDALLVAFQLSLAPMMVFTVRIEDRLAMPVDGLQRRSSSKERWIVLLGRPGEVVRRCEHGRVIVLGLPDRLGEIRDRLPQIRKRRAVVQHNRLVEAF